MGDFNVDLSEVQKAQEVVANQETTEVSTDESGENMVVFYILMGLLCLTGIGLPIVIFVLVKKNKKLKDELEAAKKQPTETQTTEEKKEEAQEKAPETK